MTRFISFKRITQTYNRVGTVVRDGRSNKLNVTIVVCAFLHTQKTNEKITFFIGLIAMQFFRIVRQIVTFFAKSY